MEGLEGAEFLESNKNGSHSMGRQQDLVSQGIVITKTSDRKQKEQNTHPSLSRLPSKIQDAQLDMNFR